MSDQAIRGALQAKLATITPALATAYENRPFTPPAQDVPYQEVTTVFTDPVNTENNAYYRQEGVFQVRLAYPEGNGAGPATTRAELIRTAFRRGLSLDPIDGITTTIWRTAAIGPSGPAGGRYWVPVRIRFWAHVTA